jgi:type I restriction enzyme R subunit
MDASALYEPPFSSLHAGGPDELFIGKENVIEGIFEKLKADAVANRRTMRAQQGAA